jgi:hypothetical protein
MALSLCLTVIALMVLHEGVEGVGCPCGVGQRLGEAYDAYAATGRAVVYICRHDTNCGGWGDRFAGIAGAVSYALQTNRTFFLFNRPISLYFRSACYDWEYTPRVAGSRYVDTDKLLREGRIMNIINQASFNPQNWDRQDLAEEGQVYMFNNRGPSYSTIFHLSHDLALTPITSVDMSAKSEQAVNSHKLNVFYRCLFLSLFQPTGLLNSLAVEFFGREMMRFHELRRLMAQYFVISIHFRLPDRTYDSSFALPHNGLACLSHLLATHRADIGEKKVAVYFSTNIEQNPNWTFTPPNVTGVSEFFFRKRAQYEQSHINSQQVRNTSLHAIDVTFGYTIVDWYLLLDADILVLPVFSGFSAAAAAVGRQVALYLLTLDSCSLEDFIPCVGRLCS